MSEQSDLRRRIAKRSRKLGMLVNSNRFPDQTDEIRRDFKRGEKLAEQREKIAERRARQKR